MNTIDPKIYNYKNLNQCDQIYISSQYKILLLIRNEKNELKEGAKHQKAINKFLYDVTIEELSELEKKVTKDMIKSIVTFIDNYDYYVKEQKTNDYFYGMEAEAYE